MAGVFFWHKTQEIDPEKVNEAFSSLEYKPGKFLKLGDWNAIVFPKTSYNIQNWLVVSDGAICGTGTFAYKGKVYEQALPIIANDIRNNNLDPAKFWGSFLILANIGNRHLLIRDGAGLARLHGLRDKPVYSSSFAGLLRCSPTKLRFNKESAVELLSTGLITGNETIVEEIDHVNLSYEIKLIDQVLSSPDIHSAPKSRIEAIIQQVDIAKNYFINVSHDWFDYMPDSVFDISITGGLDSRLVTAFVLSLHRKIKFYTFWRNENSKDPDFRLAKNIANHLDIPIYFKEVRTADQLTDQELMNIFKAGHDSCDGVIRPGTYWDEEFSNSKYRLGLTPLPYLRMSGFGGELYRNMERLPLKSSRSYKSWARWEMIYCFAGHNFKRKKDLHLLESRIVANLEKLLGNGYLNLLTFKEYYRKVLVVSYRSLQTNMENRYGFLISPLADANISILTRLASRFLGNSLQFEIDMLNKVSPELAKLPNDYGIDFSKSESEKHRIGVNVWQSIPPPIKHRLFSLYNNRYKNDFVYRLANKSSFVKSLIQILESTDLPLELMEVAKRNVRGKLVLNLGYFLQANEEWLTW